MTTSSDEYLRRLRGAAAETEAELERMREVGRRLAEVTVTERSPDGSAEVTVDHNGALTVLALGEQARRLRPAALAAVVMDCVHRAQGRIGERYEQRVRSVAGPDAEAVSQVVGRYRQRYPQRFAEDDSCPPPRSQAGDEAGIDESQSIMLPPVRRNR